MDIYLVGGAVRDQLLGLAVQERDWVVVGSTPEAMHALGYQPVGKDFPVFLHPHTHEEYALARTERKTAAGYKGFVVHADSQVSLEEDLQRRDLTINAIAQSAEGTLIDPFNGQEDLRLGLLRHVSPAFVEDPVRILRVARFAARFASLGFRVAHSTHALMKTMVANGEVDALVPERVWKELSRALLSPHPEKFFTVLQACGALERVAPPLACLFTAAQGARHQAHALVPAVEDLQQAVWHSGDPRVRFAAFLRRLPAHAVNALCQQLRVPNDYAELALLTVQHLSTAQAVDSLEAEALLQFLEQLDAFRREARFALFVQTLAALAPDAQAAVRCLQQALQVAVAVQARQFVEQGLQGTAIKAALHSARAQAIAACHQMST